MNKPACAAVRMLRVLVCLRDSGERGLACVCIPRVIRDRRVMQEKGGGRERERDYFPIFYEETVITKALHGTHGSLTRDLESLMRTGMNIAFSDCSSSPCIVLTCFQCKSFRKLDFDTTDDKGGTISRETRSCAAISARTIFRRLKLHGA